MAEYLFWAIRTNEGSEFEYIEDFKDTKAARAFAVSLFKKEPIGRYGVEYSVNLMSKIPFNAKIVDITLKKHLGTVVLYNGNLYWMVVKTDDRKQYYQMFYPMTADGTVGTKGTRSISNPVSKGETRYFVNLYITQPLFHESTPSKLMPFSASDVFKARIKAADIVSRYPPYPQPNSALAILYKGTPQGISETMGILQKDKEGTYVFKVNNTDPKTHRFVETKYELNPATGRLGRRL